MARTRKLNLFASCCLLASVWALYLTDSRQSVAEFEQRQAAPVASSPNRAGPSAETQRHRDLNAKVEQFAKSLEESTDKLNAAMGSLERSQNPRQPTHFTDEELARQMAAITPPSESVQTAPDGRVTRTVAFDELIGVHGQKLATAVIFKGAYGRRLVFRGPDNQPLAFDAEEVHPGVLAHLRIRLSEVLAANQREQENRRLRAEASNRRRLANAREAESRNAARPAEQPLSASSIHPTTQSTYITIQQPSSSALNTSYPNYPYYGYSSYSFPVYYGRHYNHPFWSHGYHTPTIGDGSLGSPPTTRQLPQVQAAMASGFRFNNTFKFNR